MPEWSVAEIRQRSAKAVAYGRAATIQSVFVKLQVGLAYCKLATTTTNPSWKMHYQDSAQDSLSEALRIAANVHLESEVLIHDGFVAAATLLQSALAKLDAEANPPTAKMQKPESRIHTAP